MTETPPPNAAQGQAPPALTEDQTSGRLFVRWNLGALVIGLVALVIGGAIVRAQRAAAHETPSTSPAPAPGDR